MAKRRRINIDRQTAGKGLQEIYKKEADKRRVKYGSLLEDVFNYFLEHQEEFGRVLEGDPRPRGGKHISIPLSDDSRKKFDEWKGKNGRLGASANFVLERALEIDIFTKI